MFIKYEAKISSRVSGGERGVVDFGKLFTEINEHVAIGKSESTILSTKYNSAPWSTIIGEPVQR